MVRNNRVESRYIELAKGKIQNGRNVVISEYSKGGFTMVQQLVVPEGNHETLVFLKGGFHFDNLEGLYELRDALNIAIKKVEKN